ncbi:MAG: ribosome small subunit-dependent GTPase A [Porphyromonadaceae bacterium]|nr:ribosome small subunit-dependent GTPase A [Porphyromonadaceae bacterium]
MDEVQGLVIRNTGSHYLTLCDDGVERACLAKGNLRLKGIRSTNPIVVGDRVLVRLTPDGGGEAHFIKEILPRRNYILRRAANLSKQSHILAANLDASLLVCTIAAPQTSTTFIDRFLANAEAYRVPTELVFNKVDSLTPEGLDYLSELTDLYSSIGYPCHVVSALTGEGLETLRRRIEGHITLLSGHSGVGKSTLINALIPGVELRTGDISESHYTGIHTTTFSQMIALLSGNGYLIDTPGIKGFGLLEVDEYEASHYFREIFALQEACRFGNCTHTHEPNCAVRLALEEGAIAASRYHSYLSILDERLEGKYRPEY